MYILNISRAIKKMLVNEFIDFIFKNYHRKTHKGKQLLFYEILEKQKQKKNKKNCCCLRTNWQKKCLIFIMLKKTTIIYKKKTQNH